MDETLAFVAGERHHEDVSGSDSDLFSWLLMNSDLVPMNNNQSPSRRNILELSHLNSDINILGNESKLILNSGNSTLNLLDEKKDIQLKTNNKTRNTRKPSTSSATTTTNKKVSDISPVKPPLLTSTSKSSSTTTSPVKKNNIINTNETVVDNNNMDMDDHDQDLMNDDDFKNLTAEQKRLRRLEKNREIAKNCRKRKREKIGALEEELTRLREWNRQLEKKLNQTDDGIDREDIRLKEMKEITQMVATKVTESEIRKKLEVYKEVYSDFGKERRVAITYHLEQLKSLLLPNQVSKMTLWSLEQDDEFYDEKKKSKYLWWWYLEYNMC